MSLNCFKAYDIRGRIPDELNADIAYRVGRAFAHALNASRVIVGHDIRLSSPELADAVSRGLTDGGADVYDIGLCGTEEVYFATFHGEMDGGIMVTASHNPMDYNGLKLVREQAKPVSGDSGLKELQAMVERNEFPPSGAKGRVQAWDARAEYIDHLLDYVDGGALKPLRVVVNAGNGGAGLVVERLESRLPFEFVKVNHEPDGTFPNGIPNPLLPENRAATADAVVETGADLGVAWDGDFDRCFLFDEDGRFIEGYYIVGLLAQTLLRKHPGSKIIHDPRLTWNTVDLVKEHGGVPVQSKTGHAFIKERMRAEDALYGGEMSAHHYFREFSYCDSGMIPWLLVAELISKTGKPLSQLVDERIRKYPASGEINRTIEASGEALAFVQERYGKDAVSVDFTDGLSMEFENWRFNLRCSNTEPLVRLNVESRGDEALMQAKTEELLGVLERFAG